MIRRKTNITKAEVDAEERSLKMRGYKRGFGSSELGLQTKEYLIAEEMGSFGKDKRFRIAWKEE